MPIMQRTGPLGADAERRNIMRSTRGLAIAAFGLALAAAGCGGSQPGPAAPASVLPLAEAPATTVPQRVATAPPSTAAPATTPATTRATTPATTPATTRATTATTAAAASVYYANCTAARAAGAAPVRRGEPGYASHLDRDNDGIGCE